MQIVEPSGPSLMAHQEACTRHLCRNGGVGNDTLVAMGARLGKSVSTVEAAYRLGKQRILVVAPVTILDGWVEEIAKWWRGDEMPIQKAHGRVPTSLEGWTFTNYETLRGRLRKIGKFSYELDWPSGYDTIVFDESVKIKSRKAQNTFAAECLARANPQATRWLLSANPAPKDLSDLWTQLYLVAPSKAGKSFWQFADRYCRVEQDQWGTKIVGNRIGAEEAIYRDFGDAIWRPDPSLVPELTPISLTITDVPLRGEQLRVYLEMEARFKALLNQMTGQTILAPNVMVQGIRLLQIASNPILVDGMNMGAKWDHVIEQITRPDWSGPSIIWTAFKSTVDLLAEDLRRRRFVVGTLTGDTPQRQRTATRHAFQAGSLDLILAHPSVSTVVCLCR